MNQLLRWRSSTTLLVSVLAACIGIGIAIYLTPSTSAAPATSTLEFRAQEAPKNTPIWLRYARPSVYWFAKDGSVGWGMGPDSVWRYQSGGWRRDVDGSIAATGVTPKLIWASTDGQDGWALGKGGVLRLKQGKWSRDFPASDGIRDLEPTLWWLRNDGGAGWCFGTGGVLQLDNGLWKKKDDVSQASQGLAFTALWVGNDGGEGWALAEKGVALRLINGGWVRFEQFSEAAPGFSATALWMRSDGKAGWALGLDLLLEWNGEQWIARNDATAALARAGDTALWVRDDGREGWIAGDRLTLKLENGNWREIALGVDATDRTQQRPGLFMNPDGRAGWILGVRDSHRLEAGEWIRFFPPWEIRRAPPRAVFWQAPPSAAPVAVAPAPLPSPAPPNETKAAVPVVTNWGQVLRGSDTRYPTPEDFVEVASAPLPENWWKLYSAGDGARVVGSDVWLFKDGVWAREKGVQNVHFEWFSEQGDNGWVLARDGEMSRLRDGKWFPTGKLANAEQIDQMLIRATPDGSRGWALGDSAGATVKGRRTGTSRVWRLEGGNWSEDKASAALLFATRDPSPWTDLGRLWLSRDGERAWRFTSDSAWRWDGASWLQVPGPRGAERSLWISEDGQSGWACRNGLWRLQAGSWQAMDLDPATSAEHACWWNDSGTEGWAVGDRSVLRLEAGKWSVDTPASEAAAGLGAVSALWMDPAGRLGWAIGRTGVLQRTARGWARNEQATAVLSSGGPELSLSLRSDGRQGWATTTIYDDAVFRLEALDLPDTIAATAIGETPLAASYRLDMNPIWQVENVELISNAAKTQLLAGTHFESGANGDSRSFMLKAEALTPDNEFELRLGLRHASLPGQNFYYQATVRPPPWWASLKRSSTAYGMPSLIASVLVLGFAFVVGRRMASRVAEQTLPTPHLSENEAEANLRALELNAKASFRHNRERGLSVDTLRLTKVPFFGDVTWELQQVNVLVGKNGYGKSHLLRLIAALLARDVETVQQFLSKAGNDALVELDLAAPPGTPSSEASASPITIRRTAEEWQDKIGKVPVLAIGDTRTIDRSRELLERPTLRAEEIMPEGAAYHFIRQVPNSQIVENSLFLLCLDYVEAKSDQSVLFTLLHRTIAQLADSAFKIASIERPNNAGARYQILVKTEGSEDPVPLRYASQGTLSVLSMFLQIYFYLASLYPDLQRDPARLVRQRAIVIIDEIDAHLHPSWQRCIVPALRAAFPNVQLILSAHSPLVVAGCRAGEVAALQRSDDKAFSVEIFEQDFLGWEPADILKKVQQIEDPRDVRYLESLALGARKGELQAEQQQLEKLRRRTPLQEDRLNELDSLLADIARAERRASAQLETEELRGKVESLESELLRLRQPAASGSKRAAAS